MLYTALNLAFEHNVVLRLLPFGQIMNLDDVQTKAAQGRGPGHFSRGIHRKLLQAVAGKAHRSTCSSRGRFSRIGHTRSNRSTSREAGRRCCRRKLGDGGMRDRGHASTRESARIDPRNTAWQTAPLVM